MAFLITTLAAILIFGIVVMIHELGHFVCAKWAGVQVNEFSIGMGPSLFSRVHNGTRYSIRALPVGGYVSMEGEDGTETDDELDPLPQQEKTGIPFNKVPVHKRIVVLAAGAVMNLILGFVVLLILFGSGDMLVSRNVAMLDKTAPIASSGIQVGDEILAINGRRCFVANDIIYELQRSTNHKADFTVRRNGEKLQFNDVKFNVTENEAGQPVMNMGFKVYALPKTPGNVISQSVLHTAFYARMVFRSVMDLLTGRVSVTQLSGPVGIVTAINQAVTMGWDQLLSLVALLTINLGVFNLLPIPALDGGKLVFLVYEGIFRRPVPQKLEIWVNMAGLVFLFGLMLFATFNDFGRLFG